MHLAEPLFRMFEKLTLITPTYRRPKYVSRLVSFYSRIPVNLIIVDGTEGDPLFGKTNLSSAGSIRYFHQPGRSFGDRLAFALRHLSTPYVAWLGDATGNVWYQRLFGRPKIWTSKMPTAPSFQEITRTLKGLS